MTSTFSAEANRMGRNNIVSTQPGEDRAASEAKARADIAEHIAGNGAAEVTGGMIVAACDATPREGEFGQAATADAATDIVVTAVEHGLGQGWSLVVPALAGGAPLTVNTVYYARDVTPTTFKVAASPGGPAIDITTDMTGLVRRWRV